MGTFPGRTIRVRGAGGAPLDTLLRRSVARGPAAGVGKRARQRVARPLRRSVARGPAAEAGQQINAEASSALFSDSNSCGWAGATAAGC